MNVLVIGGNRFAGRMLLDRLIDRGYSVTVFNRGRIEGSYPLGVTHIRGNRKDRRSLEETRRRASYDVLVDMAAYEADDISGIRRVFAGQIAQYVFISSSFVYAVTRDPICPMAEDQFARELADPSTVPEHKKREYAYGISKRACEAELERYSSRDFAVTILRPAFMFGERDHALLPCYVSRLLDGHPVILPDGGLNSMNLAYARDVAGVIAQCVGNPRVYGEIMNVANDEIVTVKMLLLAIARHLTVTPELVEIPSSLVYQHVESVAFPCSNSFDIILSSEHAKRLVGFSATPFDEALGQSVKDVAARCGQSPDEEYHRNRPQELRVAELWRKRVSVA